LHPFVRGQRDPTCLQKQNPGHPIFRANPSPVALEITARVRPTGRLISKNNRFRNADRRVARGDLLRVSRAGDGSAGEVDFECAALALGTGGDFSNEEGGGG
jgi:hypothetical protein